MKDRYRKSNPNPVIAESIGRNYYKLRALCFRQFTGMFASRNYDDIFQDTVLYVIHDDEALRCLTDESLIKHFLYRFRMIEFQTIRNAQQIKCIYYADYIQAKEETKE